jgi:hypothetical protein
MLFLACSAIRVTRIVSEKIVQNVAKYIFVKINALA